MQGLSSRRRIQLIFAQSVAVLLCGAAACGVFDGLIGLALEDVPNQIRTTSPDPGEPVYLPQDFVNWESPHVSPMALTPDGLKLLAVNTAAARLEVFDVTDNGLSNAGFVPVGLDPVTVRAVSNNEVWVVNHVSDSISVVDLSSMNVVRTLNTGDEPTDVAFAGGRAFVVCSQRNRVEVFDLGDLATAPRRIELQGEDPRACAVRPDGRKVYVAIFESGNGTTVIRDEFVSDLAGPYGGMNPPPNMLDGFFPEMKDGQGISPETSLILRKDAGSGLWLDENGMDFSFAVTWDVHDHDVAVIDVDTLDVSYITSLMNLNMAIGVRPDGQVTVVGTEAINEVRFEPNLTGQFVRSTFASAHPAAPNDKMIVDLNPHLREAYENRISTISVEARAASIADPRAIVWSMDGATGFVCGMGSNNVAKIDALGGRIAQLDVGQGPTGLVLDEASGRLYVMNKFDASIAIVDPNAMVVASEFSFFDPTPTAVKEGRPFLYDARRTSGLGVTACGACHIDGRMDQLAWDLGNPAGDSMAFNQQCDDLAEPRERHRCEDFHPVKGPMTTQTLQGIVGQEPFHWRGDRENLAAFNPAFVGLNGAEEELSADDMAKFEAFVSTLVYPPNPNRNLDNSLKANLDGANPRRGRELFQSEPIDTAHGRIADLDDFIRPIVQEQLGPVLACSRCHTLPAGTNKRLTSAQDLTDTQSLKVPQLRNVYEKTGFFGVDSAMNNRGFGFTHDGGFATLPDFFAIDVFDFGEGVEGERKLADIIGFLMSASVDTHAGVGFQVTDRGAEDAETASAIDLMLSQADRGQVGLIVRGRRGGERVGFAYRGSSVFQSDQKGLLLSADELRGATAAGSELTWTVVPLGSETRLGIDADLDRVLNGDEGSE